jgi:hypothetical protein
MWEEGESWKEDGLIASAGKIFNCAMNTFQCSITENVYCTALVKFLHAERVCRKYCKSYAYKENMFKENMRF